jgi:hypothetical protein
LSYSASAQDGKLVDKKQNKPGTEQNRINFDNLEKELPFTYKNTHNNYQSGPTSAELEKQFRDIHFSKPSVAPKGIEIDKEGNKLQMPNNYNSGSDPYPEVKNGKKHKIFEPGPTQYRQQGGIGLRQSLINENFDIEEVLRTKRYEQVVEIIRQLELKNSIAFGDQQLDELNKSIKDKDGKKILFYRNNRFYVIF